VVRFKNHSAIPAIVLRGLKCVSIRVLYQLVPSLIMEVGRRASRSRVQDDTKFVIERGWPDRGELGRWQMERNGSASPRRALSCVC
jgi:hypothetical protein